MDRPPLSLPLEDLNLEAAERRMCIAALEVAGNIVGAAQLLGVTRHALKRRMIKLDLDRPKPAAARAPRAHLARAGRAATVRSRGNARRLRDVQS